MNRDYLNCFKRLISSGGGKGLAAQDARTTVWATATVLARGYQVLTQSSGGALFPSLGKVKKRLVSKASRTIRQLVGWRREEEGTAKNNSEVLNLCDNTRSIY